MSAASHVRYNNLTLTMSSNIYWQPELETMSRDKLAQLQLEKLKATVERAAKSPYYSRIFQEKGITPSDIRRYHRQSGCRTA